MIHKNTSNESFINMWHFLQDNNVENNIFMLETKNKDLLDLDLTDLKNYNLIHEECKENIWFFFRECVKLLYPITTKSSNRIYMPFILTPESMAMIYLYDKGINFLKNKFNTIVTDIGIGTTLKILELYDKVFKSDVQYTYHLNLKHSDDIYCLYNTKKITRKYEQIKDANLRFFESIDDFMGGSSHIQYIDSHNKDVLLPRYRNEGQNINIFMYLYKYNTNEFIKLIHYIFADNSDKKKHSVYGINYNNRKVEFSKDDKINDLIYKSIMIDYSDKLVNIYDEYLDKHNSKLILI